MQTPNYYAISSQEPDDSKLPHKTCVYLWTFAFSFESDAPIFPRATEQLQTLARF